MIDAYPSNCFSIRTWTRAMNIASIGHPFLSYPVVILSGDLALVDLHGQSLSFAKGKADVGGFYLRRSFRCLIGHVRMGRSLSAGIELFALSMRNFPTNGLMFALERRTPSSLC